MMMVCPVGRAELDWVRLHVVAADDSAEAQALKLEVRDVVLTEARSLLKNVKSADAAWLLVNENLDALESAARACVSTEGVACETGVFPFPDRQYGDLLVPAGNYRALRVVIGAGEGRNWWCVLYPTLCDPEAVDPDAPVFYSAIWNWLKGLLGGEAS